MSVETEKYCTILIHYEKGVPPTSEELAKKLESKKETVQAEALEELILLMINGESYPKLLMTIIRFVVTSRDHRVKKLLQIYWEIVEKTKDTGDLKEEMILVCNALRNDLMHANEYVCGSTLRLLCKMKYYRILEPLKEAVLRNLSHRHSYVRRNAVMCVFSIVKSFGVEVLPEAPEDIEQLLLVEGDLSTKRNAFLMLVNCDQERAIKYVLSLQEQVSSMGDIFQLAVLELVRKVCRSTSVNKGRFLRIVFDLAASSSTAVSYECASSLVTLSSSPVAIHQAAQAYVQLLTEQSDNNVKLIVLDRLRDVQKHHKQVMEGMVMDIFRALSCPSLDVRKKVVDICLGSLVSPRNIKDIVALLKKEVIKTLGYEASNTEGNLEYRRLLIRALHACTGQYPDQAQSVMFLLMDFLTESDQTTATEVVMFLRELIANYSEMRLPILQRLAECIGDVSQSRVLRGCLWLFGEYCEDEALIESVIQAVLTSLRPLPLVTEDGSQKEKKEGAGGEKKKEKKAPKITTKTVVLADGTYGTQNVYEGEEGEEEEVAEEKGKADVKKTAFRTLLLGGDFLLSAMVGVSLTKLCMKLKNLPVALRNEVLLVIVNILKLVKQHVCGGEKCDSAVRLSQCIRAFAVLGKSQLSPAQLAAAQLVQGDWSGSQGRAQLAKVLELASQNSEWALGQEEEVQEKSVAPDECIVFRQLRERKGGAGPTGGMDDDEDFHAARGATIAQAAADGALFAERLAKVQQMTGLADPVYVEAFLQVHSFDLMLELLVVNRTNETLQNVLVELSTQGDLKLVDRPSAVTLSAGQQMTLHASIKVASTETGIIFGYVTFEKKSAADKECSVLNELHVDILDYIERSWINELAFRTMWSEFEWENKVNINTSITEVGTFLEHIMRNTNMSIVGRSYKKTGEKNQKKGKLTAEDVQDMLRDAVGIKKLIDTSSFVAVNLYAKSIFGEDALANISIEKLPDGKLTGSCRIRSRTQGIALSLGDRITIVQRGVQVARE
ncbi:Coatomer subunit beta (Beta-coat protein) (Beta-COP) [Durusdinium trenchii]|uniref:Coatomer subunit beta n=1 Tax=Durusdinium trenchii TaxID=1381693 RepID=A0ABP0MNE1_9DINO